VKSSMLLTLLGVALFLGGCAAPAHRAYNPSERNQIRSIGLLTPTVPDEVAVRMMVHPGQSLGLLGLLVARGDMSGKTGEFTRSLRSRGFRNGAGFEAQLKAGLTAAGYRVSTISAPRPREQDAFRNQYPKSDGSVDAYLDLYSDLIGYVAAGGNTPYRPTVNLNVRLVRARDHKVLYQDRIAYNPFGDGDGAITLPPAPGFEFAAYGDLTANPAKAAEGLNLAIRAAGDELARQLR
jgi:hypothetical protein